MKPQERGQNRKYRIQWPISFYHILISPYFPFWICQKWVIKTMRHRQLRRPPRDRSPRRSQGLSCHRGRSWMQLRRLRRIPSPLIFLDTPQMKPWFRTGSIHVGVQKMGGNCVGNFWGWDSKKTRLLAPLWLQEILEGLVESILFAMRWLKLLVLQITAAQAFKNKPAR